MNNLRFAVLTISDRSSRGERPDTSGPALSEYIQSKGGKISCYKIIPDDFDAIKIELTRLCETDTCDIILTTGGTGVTSRDVTPEATTAVIEKPIPGISEHIRFCSMEITHHAMLSRGVAGICNRSIIINLPGSPKGAVESLGFVQGILPHAIAQLHNLPNSQEHTIQSIKE